jgi:CheY-like chemotaxis protein
LEIRLTANDYEVVIATSGQEGLDKAEAEKPDLMLLDVTMPEMDGIEVGTRLKQNEATKNIPVIMLTARGERNIINLAMQRFSPEGYIIKPFTPEKLLGEIERALSK